MSSPAWRSGQCSLATLNKHEDVKALLGREPRGPFEVVLRDDKGGPVVIRNGPVLDDGTPMPTRYWLVGRQARLAVDRLEAAGGVNAAEAPSTRANSSVPTSGTPPRGTPLSRRAGSGHEPAVGWAGPGEASSASMPITPGTSLGATTRWAVGWPTNWPSSGPPVQPLKGDG